ncbi:MAG: hypothetical protein ACI86H_001408 [bacterium]|jgi:uncharacterized protein (DUF58 family)
MQIFNLDQIQHAAISACQKFILNHNIHNIQGNYGSHLGRGMGNSIEFHDFRDYVPGDDIRHIDWSAYGRSDRLVMKLYREEISPLVEIILDTSHSMSIDDGRKGELALELTHFFRESCRVEGGAQRVYLAGNEFRRLDGDSTEQIQFQSNHSLVLEKPRECLNQLKAGGLRIIISDFMTKNSPEHVIRQLSEKTAQLVVIQVLGPWESNPTEGSFYTLEDSENSEQNHVQVTPETKKSYLKRLHLLQEGIRSACIQSGAIFIEIVAKDHLSKCLSEHFAPLGLVNLR